VRRCAELFAVPHRLNGPFIRSDSVCGPFKRCANSSCGGVDHDVPKNDPRDVAKAIVDAVESGETEVLADDVTRHFKPTLAGPVEGLSIPTGA
jgi:hypothetical protein